MCVIWFVYRAKRVTNAVVHVVLILLYVPEKLAPVVSCTMPTVQCMRTAQNSRVAWKASL